MARFSRQTITGTYHIINRGTNHEVIFFYRDDYQFFLGALELAKEKYLCKVYSFILMSNHIHLLIEPVGEEKNLAHFMKHIAQRYGQR